MLGSLSYIITSISLALIIMGFTRTIPIEQALATMVVAVTATILGLTVSILATKGREWVLKAIKITGLFTIVHLFTLELPIPGGIIFTTNVLFCFLSAFLLKKVLARSESPHVDDIGV
ncbi:MAG: hypothetical protein COB51_13335 [Moraxellaceae bacterium]|nr:MAG: hypothetical protein COB51_13335 [Moraxellaceae bacterium]